MEYKDYYQILGIGKDADEDGIRKAFRKLARKYHPDVAKDKDAAEAKFKEINEAYEVLSDPEKRQKYDQLGPNWEQFAQGVPPGAAGGYRTNVPPSGFEGYEFRQGDATGWGGFEFSGTGFSDFFETFFGGGASRWSDGGTFTRGPREARGGGPRMGRDIQADIMVTLEEALRGSTRQVTLKRRDPQSGDAKKETYSVRIPAGVREGQLIRMAGQGEAGAAGGKAGDLFLHVRLERHPDFRVQGSDLYYELPVAPWEAALGAKITIPTLEGRVAIKIPAGTGSGRKLRLRGQGLPLKSGGRGDLHAEVTVAVPAKVAAEERKLWEKLQATSTWDPRA
ncbi:MAG: J domain-containing protein [Verrucomicrobiota bacterium]